MSLRLDDTSTPLRSCLYECRVLHHRRTPREHRFVYRLFYFAIDLDEAGRLDRRSRLFSWRRGNVFSFRDDDFLPIHEPAHNPTRDTRPVISLSLKGRVLAFCAERGLALAADARVTIVTLPRVFGHRFNPVSFYFCHDADGTPRAAIAEVTNTFREVKPYFVPFVPGSAGQRGTFRLRVPKHFYVSPFAGVETEFDFALRTPGDRLAIRIDGYEQERVLVHSTLTGDRVLFTDARLGWFLLKYPFVTIGILLRIHWQALRLWVKRVPFLRKEACASSQRDLHRPHSSLTHTVP
jgi:DUF1365 family protein